MQFFSSLSASVHLTTERSDEVYEYLLAIFFLTLHVPRQAVTCVYNNLCLVHAGHGVWNAGMAEGLVLMNDRLVIP